MKPHLAEWLAKVWSGMPRAHLAGEYAALRGSRHLLADIAMRNHVFAPLPDDPHQMAIAEGRRRAALEILDLARCPVEEIAGIKTMIKEDHRRVT